MIVNSKHIEKPDKKMQFGKQGILFHASSTSGPNFAQFDSMSTAFRATAKNDLWPISQCQRQPILAEGPCLASVCR